MKNTPSTSSHESILFSETHKPVTHTDIETHVENPEEDDNEAPGGARDKRLQSLLEMISLCTLWMTHQEPLKKHTPLLTLTIGRKRCEVRWIQLCLMKLGKLLIVRSGAEASPHRRRLKSDTISVPGG